MKQARLLHIERRAGVCFQEWSRFTMVRRDWGITMPTEAPTLRQWAMKCAAQADNPKITPAERERLLKMRDALLDLANEQDWLDGRKKPSAPQQQQQRQRRKSLSKVARAGRRPR